MACSSLSYLNRINKLCRKCDIQEQESGNPHIKCNNIIMENIQKLIKQNDTEQLKALNQYNVQNAWFDVDFGGCPYGIFSAACPVEPLHALKTVLYLNVSKSYFQRLVHQEFWLN